MLWHIHMICHDFVVDLIFFAHTRVQREDRAWSTSKRLVPAAVGCASTVYARVFTSPVPRLDVHAERRDAQVSRCLHIKGKQWLSERTACVCACSARACA